ncbi:MAG: cytochrome ubiquinol oxidase subunit I [Phycisphaerales bacterium]|nr:MAG: cytochrome ubiquinol oxidase subunit I [Phycisphaerales bacterium]
MDLDAVFLARLQFAITIAFHYIFPPLSIGLGVLMVFMEGAYLKTGDRQYEAMAKFWTRIFALIFAVGVASGIVMEFQFGTNWATYSRFVGDIFGSALAAEGIFAFFLESGFLAVLVFGWDRVSARMHFFSTVMVSLGSMFSAVWIVVANSWQQTPAGYHIVGEDLDRRAEITDFWAVVFNPSTLDRLIHVLIGAFILGGFFVMSVSAYYLLRRRHETFARRSFSIALPFATVFSIAALISGHSQAITVSRTQPAKLAAFEGHFTNTEGGAPLYLFGIPDETEQRVKAGLAIPGMLSFLVHNDFNQPVTALDDPAIVPGQIAPHETIQDYWPPVNPAFQLYHLMVGLGFLFIVLTVLAAFFRLRGTLFQKPWLLWVFVFAVIGPMVANQVGWAAAEIGRQPWIVYGMLKTADAASPAVSGQEVLISIIMFGLVYLLLLLAWIFVMDSKIKQGPESPEQLAAAAAGKKESFLKAATRLGDRSSPDPMTDARGRTTAGDNDQES